MCPGRTRSPVPPQARHHRADQVDLAGGRAYDLACGQIDIGNAATELTEAIADGVLQPDGSVRPEPQMDVADVACAVLYMAELPLDANVATMTVMATTMPFVGRG